MLIYLLDTNVISEVSKPQPNEYVSQSVSKHSRVCAISSVTWHEVCYGIERLPAGKRRRELERFLDNISKIPVLDYTRPCALKHSRARIQAEAQGKTLAHADGQIGAIADVHQLILVTRNVKDFAGYLDLKIENWFEPPITPSEP